MRFPLHRCRDPRLDPQNILITIRRFKPDFFLAEGEHEFAALIDMIGVRPIERQSDL